MSLITKVKAGSISSLSDARYFAGMGVDWIGFNVNPKSEMFVSPELYKSIAGWVTGPKKIIEIPADVDLDVEQLLTDYQPDGVQVHYRDLRWRNAGIPIFASARVDELDLTGASNPFGRCEYLVLDLLGNDPLHSINLLQTISKSCPILLSVEPQQNVIRRIIDELPIAGVALKGSNEIKTGLKEYDYSELLEQLEEG